MIVWPSRSNASITMVARRLWRFGSVSKSNLESGNPFLCFFFEIFILPFSRNQLRG